jgi:hypothetical protein
MARGDAETGVAGLQRRARFRVARRDVIQHDNIGGRFLVAKRCLPRDGRFDHLQARLDMLDQGYQIRHDRTVGVISVIGLDRDIVGCGLLHARSPLSSAFRERGATCALSYRPVEIRVNPVRCRTELSYEYASGFTIHG